MTVHPRHATFEEGDAPKWPDKLDFVKEQPWAWSGFHGESDVDSDASDFDGGYLRYLR